MISKHFKQHFELKIFYWFLLIFTVAPFDYQIIAALEEDSTAQKMQLGYRLQQIAAAVENKITDLWPANSGWNLRRVKPKQGQRSKGQRPSSDFQKHERTDRDFWFPHRDFKGRNYMYVCVLKAEWLQWNLGVKILINAQWISLQPSVQPSLVFQLSWSLMKFYICKMLAGSSGTPLDFWKNLRSVYLDFCTSLYCT